MSIILLNQTQYAAQYTIKEGQQVIAKVPAVQPNAQMSIPVNDVYEVIATTVIEGNTYSSAPLTVSGSMGFLAQVLQVSSQGTYEFDVAMFQNGAPDQLAFQKTCINPVTFTIGKNGKPLQNVVVTSSFQTQTLDISNTFSIDAVINGIATETVTTSNPRATVTAIVDNSILGSSYYSLAVS